MIMRMRPDNAASANGGACFRLENVTKSYGGRQVLAVAELEIRRGEIFALVGPSGSGKSTFLRLLNFLELPSSGAIHFGGQRMDGSLEAPVAIRRQVTMVAQRPMLLDRSVLANVQFGLQLRGKRDGKMQAREALQRVGLSQLQGQYARTLSGGEAQRVALARAMVIAPEVLLLDEPTANLDPYNVGLIEDTVRTLNAESGITVVLVTHNVFQARRLAHRVALLLDGAVIELSDAGDFFNSPKDPRTLAFVRGEMVY